MAGTTRPRDDLDASGLTFAVIWARFNESITSRLLRGANEALERYRAEEVLEIDVPGAFELPLAAQIMLAGPVDPTDPSGVRRSLSPTRVGVSRVDAVIALGCIIRGETPHFDFVAAETARGLMDVGLATGKPVSFGVLTTDTLAQAEARAGGGKENKGFDAALVAIEMAQIARAAGEAWRR